MSSPDANPKSKLKLGLCQIMVGSDKEENLRTASAAVAEAVEQEAELVVLPECFNSPYDVTQFAAYAESLPPSGDIRDADSEKEPTLAWIHATAKKHGIFLVAGSMPEREIGGDGVERIFNTCFVVNPEGLLLARHRKLHLFDIDVPGGITFKESETLSAGNEITSFEVSGKEVASPSGPSQTLRVGVSICYDIRFPEVAQILSEEHGCQLLLYPAAFNTTTGPAHFQLVQRATALSSQAFVATCSPARNPESSYQAWGYSALTNPWGTTLAQAEHQPALSVTEIDFAEVAKVRRAIPTRSQKRLDVYTTSKLVRPQPRRSFFAGRGGRLALASAAVGALSLYLWRRSGQRS